MVGNAEGAAPDRAPRAPRRYFAVVIGTGFGGAVAACRLAQARAKKQGETGEGGARDILILERGRRYAKEDFGRFAWPDYVPSAKPTSKRLPDVARMMWGNDHGLWELRNLGQLRVGLAAGFGGGSLIYANVHLRPPSEVFDQMWPQPCPPSCLCRGTGGKYDRSGLKPYYDRVAHMLRINPLPESLRDKFPKTKAFAAAAGKLTGGDMQRFIYPPLAVTFDEAPGPHGAQKPGTCTGCGDCCIGCPEGAKNTLDLNYLALAEDAGVEVRTLCEVETIAEYDSHLHVRYVDHRSGEPDAVDAEYVFLCAGAIGSTEILMRSTAPDQSAEHRGLRRPNKLGDRFFGNGDNLAVVFDTKAPLEPTRGPTITTSILHRGKGDQWFQLQDGGMPPSLVRGFGLLRSPLWFARNRFLPVSPDNKPLPMLMQMRALLRAGGTGPWLYRNDDPSRKMPTDVLAGVARALLPKDMLPIVEELLSGHRALQEDVGDIVKSVTAALDKESPWPFGWFRRRFAKDDDVTKTTLSSLSTLYPFLTDLFQNDRAVDFGLALARFFLMSTEPTPNEAVLLAMGPDHQGRLVEKQGHLRIEWDIEQGLGLYALQERAMRDMAHQLGGQLRTNPDWTLGRRPVTVHAQGGCAMSATEADGVLRPCGRVWTCDRLLVLDGAALPGSVGTNPSSTIAAIAERNIEVFIQAALGLSPEDYLPPDQLAPTVSPDLERSLPVTLPPWNPDLPLAHPVGLRWEEEMNGYIGPIEPSGPDDVTRRRRADVMARFAESARGKPLTLLDQANLKTVARIAARSGIRLTSALKLTADSLDGLLEQPNPKLDVRGKVVIASGPMQGMYTVGGTLVLEMDTLPGEPEARVWVQKRLLRGMRYELTDGAGFELRGQKFVRDEPGFDLWKDLSMLYTAVTLNGLEHIGILNVPLAAFLQKQLKEMSTDPLGASVPPEVPVDDVAKSWALIRFGRFFFGSVMRGYSQWF
jgi:choline dehydrogenase-like flavoprotein